MYIYTYYRIKGADNARCQNYNHMIWRNYDFLEIIGINPTIWLQPWARNTRILYVVVYIKVILQKLIKDIYLGLYQHQRVTTSATLMQNTPNYTHTQTQKNRYGNHTELRSPCLYAHFVDNCNNVYFFVHSTHLYVTALHTFGSTQPKLKHRDSTDSFRVSNL